MECGDEVDRRRVGRRMEGRALDRGACVAPWSPPPPITGSSAARIRPGRACPAPPPRHGSGARSAVRVVDFESDGVGDAPKGSRSGLAGRGGRSPRRVRAGGAGASGNVVVQEDGKGAGQRYPLAILEGLKARDVDVSVRFQGRHGHEDRGRGPRLARAGRSRLLRARAERRSSRPGPVPDEGQPARRSPARRPRGRLRREPPARPRCLAHAARHHGGRRRPGHLVVRHLFDARGRPATPARGPLDEDRIQQGSTTGSSSLSRTRSVPGR